LRAELDAALAARAVAVRERFCNDH